MSKFIPNKHFKIEGLHPLVKILKQGDYLCKRDLDDHRSSGDDSVTVTRESKVDFQKVSGYVVNAGSISKGPSKAIGATIINIISNSSCPTAYKVPSETDKSTAFV